MPDVLAGGEHSEGKSIEEVSGGDPNLLQATAAILCEPAGIETHPPAVGYCLL